MKSISTKSFTKVSHLFLGAALVFVLTACGSSQETTHEEGPSTYDSVYDDWESNGERKKPAGEDSSVRKKPAETPQSSNPTSENPPKSTPVEKPVPVIEEPVVKKPIAKPEPKEEPTRPEPKTLKEIKERYVEEVNAAIDAEMAYYKAKDAGKSTAEAYVNMAVHLYGALGFRNRYQKLGGDSNELPKLRTIKIMKGDFKTTLGPSDDPRVTAAIKKWQETIE